MNPKTKYHSKHALASLALLALGAGASVMTSCSDKESFADLLRDENKAVNWFLARQRVVAEVPADSVFEVGPDAPYYRMDDDGYLYMQVINTGSDERAKKDAKVYFMYSRQNIETMEKTGSTDVPKDGNSNNLGEGSKYFFYGNVMIPSSLKYGSGVQVPLDYFGYDCEVNLVVRSYVGFQEDQTLCIPYLMNVRYFKAEY